MFADVSTDLVNLSAPWFAFRFLLTVADDEDTDAVQLMSLPVLLQRSVMAPVLAQ